MTDQEKENSKNTEPPKYPFQDEFNALPLDQKFASLFQMEVATLTDAFSYVADSSAKVFEKVGDVISDLGNKIETEAKRASTTCDPPPPPSKASAPGDPAAAPSKPKPKTSAKRKPEPPRAPKA